MQYIDAEGRIKTGAVESTDRDGVPQISYEVDVDPVIGLWVEATAADPGQVKVIASEYETVSVRMPVQEALDLAVELIRVALWARDTPLIAMHGPPYPPPGWMVENGELVRDPLTTWLTEWAASLERSDTPFLRTIQVGDAAIQVYEWGMRAPAEEDDDAQR